MTNPWHHLRGLTGTGPAPIKLGERMTEAEPVIASRAAAQAGTSTIWASQIVGSRGRFTGSGSDQAAPASEPAPKLLQSHENKPSGAATEPATRGGAYEIVYGGRRGGGRTARFTPVLDDDGRVIALAAPPD